MITLGEVEPGRRPGHRIEVEGYQWQWTFNYENGASRPRRVGQTPPALAVPVGDRFRLILESLDVNHLVRAPLPHQGPHRPPTRGQRADFTVTEPGTYSGQCAEFCGLGTPT